VLRGTGGDSLRHRVRYFLVVSGVSLSHGVPSYLLLFANSTSAVAAFLVFLSGQQGAGCCPRVDHPGHGSASGLIFGAAENVTPPARRVEG
jgi:hypothetical protein